MLVFLADAEQQALFKAAAEGDMLAVMFFSLLMGIGVAVVRTDAARRFEEAVQGLYDVTMRLIEMVIALAPIGIAAQAIMPSR